LAEENGDICGVLPLFRIKSIITGNRLVSLPFSYNCGPIATSDEALIRLIAEAKRLVSELNCDYLELKMQKPLSEAVVQDTQVLINEYYFTSVLKLANDSKENWKKLDARRTRWAINKAIRSGVTIRTETNKDDIKIFHDLKVRTRKKHGSPTPSLRFFKEIMHEFEPKGLVKLWVAEYDEKVISALMFYSFKDMVIPAYIASDDSYNSYMPNNLMYWRTIEWGCANGYRCFDFGRTEPNNGGLLKFKSKWGTDNYKIPYYYYPEKPNLMATSRGSLKVNVITGFWKRMPVPLLKLLGPSLLRHVG
jgi:FemAB-related protein (PEP-CTERM system-associated)